MLEIQKSLSAAQDIGFLTTTTTVSLSFILSTFIAYVYVWTIGKGPYSRNYIQAIVLISIIAAVIILSVGDSLARGIGIIAAVGIIRFRTNFKNPRDTVFLFGSLSAGIACGANAYIVAVEGTLCFALASVLLRYSPYSPVGYFDASLNFYSASENSIAQIEVILDEYCTNFSLNDLEENLEKGLNKYSYHIKLKKHVKSEQLIQVLQLNEFAKNIRFKNDGFDDHW